MHASGMPLYEWCPAGWLRIAHIRVVLPLRAIIVRSESASQLLYQILAVYEEKHHEVL
jgi:hypothetical protein